MAEWGAQLRRAGLNNEASDLLVANGYHTADLLQNALTAEEDVIELARMLLEDGGLQRGLTDARTRIHPVTAALRALRTSLLPPPIMPAAGPALGGPAPLALPLGPRPDILSPDRIRVLRQEFTANYPAEVLTEESEPSVQLLQVLWKMQSTGDWSHIGWKRRLSRAQADQLKDSRRRTNTLLTMLADSAGLEQEDVREDINGSPYVVHQLLSLWGTAMAVLQLAHLASTKMYISTFMSHYTTKHKESQLRPPSWQEAETADRLAITAACKLVISGWTWDQSMAELTVNRDILVNYLQPRIRMDHGSSSSDKSKFRKNYQVHKDQGFKKDHRHRGRKDQQGDYKKHFHKDRKHDNHKDKSRRDKSPVCFRFQKGQCTVKNCKFLHKCEICKSNDHGSSTCRNRKQS